MAGHREGYSKGDGKEGMSSERPYILTSGKVLTPVVGFANGIPGNPPAPKMRGDAKPVGSYNAPNGMRNPSNNGPYKAFGMQNSSNGRGGKKGLGD